MCGRRLIRATYRLLAPSPEIILSVIGHWAMFATVNTYVSMELCRLHYRTTTPSEMQDFELSTDNKPDVPSPL